MEQRGPGSRTAAAACVLAVLAASAGAQATHVVGPGGFATIGAAIAAAAPGDIVVVQPGSYTMLGLDKGLTIRAATAGTVTISSFAGTNIHVPPNETAHFVGLDFRSLVQTFDSAVTLDHCTMITGGGVLVTRDSRIHLQECLLQIVPFPIGSSNAPLVAHDSSISAVDTTFAGATGQTAVATSGIKLFASSLQASHCTISGGGPWPLVDGLVADAGSTVWLSDSSVSSDPAACPIAAPNAAGHMARTTLAPNCGALPIGPLLGVTRPLPLTTGSTFVLAFRYDPNEPIAIFANVGLDEQHGPLFAQPVRLATDCWAAGMTVANGAGSATASWTVPPVLALVDRAVWLQGFAGLTAPIELSPVVGGVIR